MKVVVGEVVTGVVVVGVSEVGTVVVGVLVVVRGTRVVDGGGGTITVWVEVDAGGVVASVVDRGGLLGIGCRLGVTVVVRWIGAVLVLLSLNASSAAPSRAVSAAAAARLNSTPERLYQGSRSGAGAAGSAGATVGAGGRSGSAASS